MSLSEAANMASRWPNGWTLEKVREVTKRITRVPVLRTLWYPDILKGLESSALAFLNDVGISRDKIQLVDVPGSFELPLTALKEIERRAANKPEFCVALGCIVQGDTPHFDFVSRACVEGLMNVQLETRVPVGLGVLTVSNMDQARARLEKGAEAAQAAFYVWLNQQSCGKGA